MSWETLNLRLISGAKLLHDRMIRVCRWGQRLAAEVAEG